MDRLLDVLTVVAGFIRDDDQDQFALLPDGTLSKLGDHGANGGTGVFQAGFIDLDIVDGLLDVFDVCGRL